MASGGSVVIKIDGDTKGFESSFEKAKSFAGKAAKGIGIAFTAAAVGVAAIGKAAVSAYGDYEQLVGGIETLFGNSGQTLEEYANRVGKTTSEASAEYEKLTAVQENMLAKAKEAYKTAGMSANDYMQNATSFAASLVSSLGGDTEKAAEYANRAMIDMSDNANKMGTNIEMITNAYQGFAKQNYTMLDNLKLGYGGTKTEMERLIQDASRMTDIQAQLGVTVDSTSMSFGNIVNAISVMQTSMNIAGTTAQEATTTIQGSLNMTKAAWDNLMVSLADPEGNIEEAINNLLESVGYLWDNLQPIIEQTLNQLPGMIQRLGTAAVDALPELIEEILPQISESALQILDAFINAIISNPDAITNAAVNTVQIFIEGIQTSAPRLLESGIFLISNLARGIAEGIPTLLPQMLSLPFDLVDSLLDNIDPLIDAGIELMLALADGLIAAIPQLLAKVPEIIAKLVAALIRNYPKMFSAGKQFIGKFFEGMWTIFASTYSLIGQYLYNYVISPLLTKAKEAVNVGKNLVQGLWNGIQNAKDWLLGKIKSWCGSILNGIKAFFGIHSPSTVMRDEVGLMIAKGLAEGIEDGRSEVQKVMDDMNKELLESEKIYNSEKERLDSDSAKTSERIAYEEEKKRQKYLKKQTDAQKKANDEKLEALKNAADEADKIQKKNNEKYLQGLKDTAEKERKLYDALQKDIKNAQKNVLKAIKDMASKAYDSLAEIEKLVDSFRDKLDKEIQLTTAVKITTADGKEIKYTKLADIKSQTNELIKYADLLQKVKQRGNVPKEFFEVLRDMSVDEGTNFAEALLAASDEDFEQYIKDWQRKEEVTKNLAKMLYRDEAEEARQEVVNGFKDLGDDLRAQGIENAEKWGEGFAQKVFELIPQIQTKISEAFNNFIATPTYAVAGSGGVSTIDLSGLSQNNSAEQNRNIILKLNNREVGRTIGESVSTEQNRIGGSFTGGR